MRPTLRPHRGLTTLAAAALSLALAGCGGGDSGTDVFNPPDDVFNVRAAWTTLLAGGPRGWTLTGTVNDGKTYEIALGVAPVANSSFPLTGVPANRTDLTTNVRLTNSTTAPAAALTELYYDDLLRVLGTRQTSSLALEGAENCSFATAAAVPPLQAEIGDGGALFDADLLGSCDPSSTRVATISTTWSLEFDTQANISFFCVKTMQTDTMTPPRVWTEQDCVETDVRGALGLRARITVSDSGTGLQLVARNY